MRLLLQRVGSAAVEVAGDRVGRIDRGLLVFLGLDKGDDHETADRMLREANCTREEADEIYELTSLCTFEERFVIPPMHREQAIEMMKEPHEHRTEAGFGFVGGPRRGL